LAATGHSGSRHWDADALRDIVRDYALEMLAVDDAVPVIDKTGFLKQGKASCGVARQYTGSAGKITNCQIGVFACYVGPRGYAFIDRELYRPKSWTDDPARMAKAHVPQEIFSRRCRAKAYPQAPTCSLPSPPACKSFRLFASRSRGARAIRRATRSCALQACE
jgi:SRSO17 transposase